MAKPRLSKQTLLPALARHVLEHGLNTASLRPLAQAAGTSDRMLIYHFGSKEGLVADLLGFIAADMARHLDAALPPGPAESLAQCLRDIVRLMRTPAMQGYHRLWFDLLSAAGQGRPVHAATGQAILAGLQDWLRSRLPADEPDPDASAALLLTVIEGILVMDTLGQAAIADAAIDRLMPGD